MDTLEDVAPRRAVDGQNALAAEDIGPAQLQERTHPFLELVGVDRTVGAERQALDRLLMVVVVAVMEKVGFELEDALQIERTLVEDGVESDPTLLGLEQAGVGVDRADPALDLRELVGAHQ